jgi:hypothetical protein
MPECLRVCRSNAHPGAAHTSQLLVILIIKMSKLNLASAYRKAYLSVCDHRVCVYTLSDVNCPEFTPLDVYQMKFFSHNTSSLPTGCLQRGGIAYCQVCAVLRVYRSHLSSALHRAHPNALSRAHVSTHLHACSHVPADRWPPDPRTTRHHTRPCQSRATVPAHARALPIDRP